MPKLNIDLRALFSYALEVFKRYPSFIFGVSFTYFALGLVPQIFIYIYSPENPTAQDSIVSIIALVVRLVLMLGFVKIMFYLIDDREVSVSDLINNGRILFGFIAAWFLFAIAVWIGAFFFILPGIYVAIRLQFYYYFIIEYNDPFWKALQKSWILTEGYFFELFVFGVCFVVLNFIGAFLLGIGMIFTYPITVLAQAVIFRSLEQNADKLPVAKYIPD